MATTFLDRFNDANFKNGPLVSFGDGIITVVDTTNPQTLTNKTLTAPTLTAPVITGASGAGQVVTLGALFTETAAGVYTATFAIPAGAVLHHIRVNARALWDAATSAVLKVGDTADDDGYFTGVDVKATDLLVGEALNTEDSTLWGGKEGAYLVAATGRRGPVSSNFGQYYAAGSNITAIITSVGAGTAGRTFVEVEYAVPTAVAPVFV